MSAATEAGPAARRRQAPATDHAARMDGVYAAQRHIYDLTRKYYLLGRDRLVEELDLAGGGSVLEVGCGTARNMALAARRWPAAHLFGLDISAEMLKSARRTLEKEGLAGRSSLALGDAGAFDAAALFGEERFDRIVFSYTLSMIPEWEAALAQGCALLAHGGSLHLVDFGQQRRLPGWFGRGLRGWLARFHVTPREDLFAVCDRLAREHGLLLELHWLYRDYARYAVLRRA